MLSKLTYIAMGVGAALVVFSIAVIRQEPPRPKIGPAPARLTLDEKWGDMPQTAAPLIKGPRIIQTIRVAPEVVPEVQEIHPDELSPVEQQKPAIKQREDKKVTATRERPDVCKRHGMRKVYVRNGKSWRCRK